MANHNACAVCNISLSNHNSHAKYCSSACRSIAWRAVQAAKVKQVSVLLKMPSDVFARLKAKATDAGLLINGYIMSQVA